MKIITHRLLIQNVARRWRETYFSNGEWKYDSGKSDIYKKLATLLKDKATAKEVNDIIGNESWTRITCNECRKDTDWVMRLGEEPDYESETACLCKSCIQKAASLMEKQA